MVNNNRVYERHDMMMSVFVTIAGGGSLSIVHTVLYGVYNQRHALEIAQH